MQERGKAMENFAGCCKQRAKYAASWRSVDGYTTGPLNITCPQRFIYLFFNFQTNKISLVHRDTPTTGADVCITSHLPQTAHFRHDFTSG